MGRINRNKQDNGQIIYTDKILGIVGKYAVFNLPERFLPNKLISKDCDFSGDTIAEHKA